MRVFFFNIPNILVVVGQICPTRYEVFYDGIICSNLVIVRVELRTRFFGVLHDFFDDFFERIYLINFLTNIFRNFLDDFF